MGNSAPTIVVVDDSLAVQKFFDLCVEKLPVDLKTYSSAADSMDYLEHAQPSLVFLDIIMPQKDGLTFLQELRRNPIHQSTQVVMISSKDYDQDKMIAKKLGAVDFVIKPMSKRTIQDLVYDYIPSTATGKASSAQDR